MTRRARRQAVGVAGLVLLTILPFAAVGAWRARPEPVTRPGWPVVTAIVRTDESGRPIAVGLLDPSSPPIAVEMDPDVVLDVPEVGTLRARTLYRIEGAPLVARGLAGLLGAEVTAWMVVDQSGVIDSNFDAVHLSTAERTLRSATVHTVRGTTTVRSGESFEQVVEDEVRNLLLDAATAQGLTDPHIAARYERFSTVTISDAGAGKSAVDAAIAALRTRGFRHVRRGADRVAVEDSVAGYFVDEDLATFLLRSLGIDGIVRAQGPVTGHPSDVIISLGTRLVRHVFDAA